ncbi:hypothetical protein BCR33DRAFT_60575 [Rhizoclosmatium globosum]|uniref:ZZ-type domain-containing protein n=1 Tax=Rhizoclosmatium globosum TaxID=329046 RepID=A0A1Y2CPE2_9FUNG|nr:hypothetical protein BCR33DRAFT_60575 [Rhizoclosmatium globosum]|eukprot:ORY48195.1 hypothetical protein BCR33DRAFT_60575 [Rhizoclosmatium globosum]
MESWNPKISPTKTKMSTSGGTTGMTMSSTTRTVVFKVSHYSTSSLGLRRFTWPETNSSVSALTTKLRELFGLPTDSAFSVSSEGGGVLHTDGDLALLLFSAAATTAAVRLSLVPFVAPVTVSSASTDTHSHSDNESDFEVVSSAAPHSDIDDNDNDNDDEHAKLVASVLIRGDDEKSDSEESTNENENENELEAASNVESVEAIYEDMDNGDPLSPIHDSNRVENPFLDPLMDALIDSVSKSMLLESSNDADTETDSDSDAGADDDKLSLARTAPSEFSLELGASAINENATHAVEPLMQTNEPEEFKQENTDASQVTTSSSANTPFTDEASSIFASNADTPATSFDLSEPAVVAQPVVVTAPVAQVEPVTEPVEPVAAPASSGFPEFEAVEPSECQVSGALYLKEHVADQESTSSSENSDAEASQPEDNTAAFLNDVSPLLDQLLSRIESNPHLLPELINRIPETLSGYNFALSVENSRAQTSTPSVLSFEERMEQHAARMEEHRREMEKHTEEMKAHWLRSPFGNFDAQKAPWMQTPLPSDVFDWQRAPWLHGPSFGGPPPFHHHHPSHGPPPFHHPPFHHHPFGHPATPPTSVPSHEEAIPSSRDSEHPQQHTRRGGHHHHHGGRRGHGRGFHGHHLGAQSGETQWMGIHCDGCGSANFNGIRYKCSECPDFDLCANCFANPESNVSHTHPFFKLSSWNDLNRRITCDGCGYKGIVGDRYKCLQCPNYDLCGNCFAAVGRVHPVGHGFMVQASNGSVVVESRPMKEEEKAVEDDVDVKWAGVVCDGCHKPNFSGARYKCTDCADYDLCSTCFADQIVLHADGHNVLCVTITTFARRVL